MTVQREVGACPSGKVRYRNRRGCRAAIDTLRNRIHLAVGPNRDWPRMWPYRCRHCNGWHMTRRDPRAYDQRQQGQATTCARSLEEEVQTNVPR